VRRLLLAAGLVVTASFGLGAPAANACAGEVCDALCYATTHNPTPVPLGLFDHPCWFA
jgi:hypothetical protein